MENENAPWFQQLKKRQTRQSRACIPEQPDAGDSSLEALLLKPKNPRLLKLAVEQLPNLERTAIILRFHQKRSYQQVATILGVSIHSLKQILQQTKNHLESYLEKL